MLLPTNPFVVYLWVRRIPHRARNRLDLRLHRRDQTVIFLKRQVTELASLQCRGQWPLAVGLTTKQ